MKKIFLISALAILFSTNMFFLNNKQKSQPIVLLKNIEALAESESGPDISCSSVCYNAPNWTCKIYYNNKFLKDCASMRAY